LWTPSKKNKIYNSRIQSTRLLAKTIAKLKKPPKIFASTSGVNYYGDSGDRILDESVPAGTGFLARVCRDWERATEYLKKTDVRTILMRFGVVLSEKGGFLKTLLPLYKMGFGSKLGKGDQFISWIVLDDLVRAVDFLIKNSDISGAVNVTSPYPIRNRDLNRVLGKTLHRPTFRVPAFMLRIVLGQMADELMLSSIRAVPDKLESGRFEFEYPFFDKAIQRLTEKEST
jgi:hypothetical protein